jgi:hypothetical protein
MTKDEIVAAMREANLKNQRPHLAKRLRELDCREVFEALFPIAADAQWHGPAYRAAALLFVLKPACPIPCKDAIRAMLPNWDVSIEEVPWYLAGQFGQEAIRQALEQLRQEPLDHEQKVRLGTVQYWTDIYFRLTPAQLQKRERDAQRFDE